MVRLHPTSLLARSRRRRRLDESGRESASPSEPCRARPAVLKPVLARQHTCSARQANLCRAQCRAASGQWSEACLFLRVGIPKFAAILWWSFFRAHQKRYLHVSAHVSQLVQVAFAVCPVCLRVYCRLLVGLPFASPHVVQASPLLVCSFGSWLSQHGLLFRPPWSSFRGGWCDWSSQCLWLAWGWLLILHG